MIELKLYVTIEVEDDFFNDENYDSNIEYVKEMLRDIAEGCQGSIVDLEIK